LKQEAGTLPLHKAMFLFMPAFNPESRKIDHEKTGNNDGKKNEFVLDSQKLAGRPDHPDQHIPARSDKEKHGIPEFFETVFH
jgi:hypothetical protein